MLNPSLTEQGTIFTPATLRLLRRIVDDVIESAQVMEAGMSLPNRVVAA